MSAPVNASPEEAPEGQQGERLLFAAVFLNIAITFGIFAFNWLLS